MTVGLVNAVVVYAAMVPCGIGEAETVVCHKLVYSGGAIGAHVVTPRSWFYYPAALLVLSPVLAAAAWLSFGARRKRNPILASAFVVSLITAPVIASCFTALAYR
jgi:hypothetical protein